MNVGNEAGDGREVDGNEAGVGGVEFVTFLTSNMSECSRGTVLKVNEVTLRSGTEFEAPPITVYYTHLTLPTIYAV